MSKRRRQVERSRAVQPSPAVPSLSADYFAQLVELRARLVREQRAVRERNAIKLARIAARLPACPLPIGHCPTHDKHEARTADDGRASTTANREWVGPDGC